MKVYIVFTTSFEVDKPREFNLKPFVRLVTTNKNEACIKLNELKEEYKNSYNEEDIYINENFLTYSSGPEYGIVGLLEENLFINNG